MPFFDRVSFGQTLCTYVQTAQYLAAQVPAFMCVCETFHGRDLSAGSTCELVLLSCTAAQLDGVHMNTCTVGQASAGASEQTW
jgi:hypothetical protein